MLGFKTLKLKRIIYFQFLSVHIRYKWTFIWKYTRQHRSRSSTEFHQFLLIPANSHTQKIKCSRTLKNCFASFSDNLTRSSFHLSSHILEVMRSAHSKPPRYWWTCFAITRGVISFRSTFYTQTCFL